jgi:DNA-binding MarR family transcriptional regulator
MSMNPTPIEPFSLTYSDKPPILISASSEPAMARAVRTVEAADYRIADTIALEHARERVEQQIAASALWIEVDRDGGAAMDELLDCVDEKVARGQFAAVVSITTELIDPIAARLRNRATELIVDADDAARAAALAIVTAHAGIEQHVADVASDQSAARLRQLSDEVSRIAATLARLSAGPAAPAPVVEAPAKFDAPEVSAETVRSVIRARRLRARYFSEELFADPAWDMLLDLLQAEIAHLRVPVSSLCIAAAVPATTALRWLKTMVSNGLFIRRADPHDGRRVFVELAPETSIALRRYFAEVGSPVVI